MLYIGKTEKLIGKPIWNYNNVWIINSKMGKEILSNRIQRYIEKIMNDG